MSRADRKSHAANGGCDTEVANTNSFHFNYSAREQEADDQIRKQYHLPRDAEIPDELRQAPLRDRKAALRVSLILGGCSLLVFGAGLSVLLTMQSALTYPLGLTLGLTGLGGLLLMPVIFGKILEKRRRSTEAEHNRESHSSVSCKCMTEGMHL